MRDDLEALKRQLPLLDYLNRVNWTGRSGAARREFVGLCPLHQETQPSFYVNAAKNLFYCQGCGRGGDLIRFIEIYHGLSFPQALSHLKQELGLSPPSECDLLDQAALFYQMQLHRFPDATQYLFQRGIRDHRILDQLAMGYAPGGNLRQYLTALGFPLVALLHAGLVDREGRDTFCRRIVFPCRSQGHVVNLYGRSIGTAAAHRFLPRSKGGLFAWDTTRECPSVILVEGLFDLAVMWQSGFRCTTTAFGTHLNPVQWAQLIDRPERFVHILFDSDENHSGQLAAGVLARRLSSAGVSAHMAQLPAGYDPNSFFVDGATASDFASYLEQAKEPVRSTFG